MKYFLIISALVIFSIKPVYSQWEQISPWHGSLDDGVVSFSLGENIYFGGGLKSDDYYRYSPETKQWTKVTDYPSGVHTWAFSFVIDGKAYVGGGANGSPSNLLKTFHSYDAETNTWTRLEDFGGGPRDGAMSFALNGKGYVVGGFEGQNIVFDTWEYNPQTDSWKKLQDFPAPTIFGSVFVIGGKAYCGLGAGQAEYGHMFEFDGVSWKKLADFPGGLRQAAVSFSYDGKGYVGGGMKGYSLNQTDFWEYNPASDSWSKADDMDYPNRYTAWSSAVVHGDMVVMGTGANLEGGSLTFTNQFHMYSFVDLPKMKLSEEVIDFGEIDNPEVVSAYLTVTNTGSANLEITSLNVEGEEGVFSIAAKIFPFVIEPGASEQFELFFSPQEPGEYIGDLYIVSNAGPDENIKMVGILKENYPSISLSTELLDFGVVETSESKTMEVTIENTGDGKLLLNNFNWNEKAQNVFTIENAAGEIEIEPGESHLLEITFSPLEEMVYSAEFSFETNDPQNESVSLNISGEGKIPASIFENGNYNNLTVYPNPVTNSGNLKIELPENSSGNFEMEIVSQSGKTVYSDRISSQAIVEINMNILKGIASGIYFIRLESADKIFVSKIIVE
jgi:N-acetylneuraminic acid mutarotase